MTTEMRSLKIKRIDVLCAFIMVAVISASFGGVAIFGAKLPISRSSSTALPFDLPSQVVLKASPKKVFAVYTPVFPISLDNLDSGVDYYNDQYLNPNGENSNYAAEGAILRERPLPRAVDPSPNWALDDMKTEVIRATNAGLDGFIFDLLATDGAVWDRLILLLKAAGQVDPNFKIMLMPDVSAGNPTTTDIDNLTSKIASIANSPQLYKVSNERLVISPFAPETQGAEWWSNFIDIMQSKHNIALAFVPTFLDYRNNVAAFVPLSYGLSNWGSRSNTAGDAPDADAYLAGFRDDAHRRGKIWMQPVALQDNRPRAGVYWEANNTENFRTGWSAAIGGADWVMIPTWNDYTENTQISPSTHIGWGPLDINSYYVTQFKLGTPPPIVRDTVYLSHRIQPYSLLPTNQTQIMNINPFSAPARDTVEILTFLKDAATVTVVVGQNNYTYTAPSGVFAMTYPLAFGKVHVSVEREGNVLTDVSSRSPIVSKRATQDLQYYFVSSGRDRNPPPPIRP